MGRRETHRKILILSAYAAYLISPLVHTAMESHGCPAGCAGDRHDDVVVIYAPCQEPCTDPTHHHHHHGHSPDDCTFCQSYPSSLTPFNIPVCVEPAEAQQPPLPLAAIVLLNISSPRPNLIRGPPSPHS